MICATCRRNMAKLTDHHLVPRSQGGRWEDTVAICFDCHDAIHAFFTNKELSARYNTVEALLTEERFARHVRWLAKQDPGKRFGSRRARDRRQRGRSG